MGTLKPKLTNHGIPSKGNRKTLKPTLANALGPGGMDRIRQVAASGGVAPGAGARYAAQARALALTPTEQKIMHDVAKTAAQGKGGGGDGLFDALKSIGGKALEVIDVPRAISVNTVGGIVRNIENIAAGHGDAGDWLHGPVAGAIAATGVGAPIAAAIEATDPKTRRDIQRHTSTQELLQRGLVKHGWEDAPVISNPVVQAGIGIAGDIGLDPLTYVLPAGGALKTGGKGLAEELARIAGEHRALAAAARGTRDAEEALAVAEKAQKGVATAERLGPGGLSKELRTIVAADRLSKANEKRAALQQAVREAGGTEQEIARAGAKQVSRAQRTKSLVEHGGLTIGFGPVRTPIPGTSGLTDAANAIMNRTIRPARAAIGDVVGNSVWARHMRGEAPELDQIVRQTTDAFHSAEAAAARAAKRTMDAEGSAMRAAFHEGAADAFKQFDKHEWPDVAKAIRGEGRLVDDPRMAGINQWRNAVHAEAAKNGVDLGDADAYLNTVLQKAGSKELKDPRTILEKYGTVAEQKIRQQRIVNELKSRGYALDQTANDAAEAAQRATAHATEMADESLRRAESLQDRLANVAVTGRQDPHIAKVILNGGHTWNPRTGEAIQGGYMVGAVPNPEGAAGAWVGDALDLGKGFADVRAQHAGLYDTDAGVFQGVWYDKTAKKYVVDPVRRTENVDEAMQLAHENGQTSIFDAYTGNEINLADAREAGTQANDALWAARENDRLRGVAATVSPDSLDNASTPVGRDMLRAGVKDAQARIEKLRAEPGLTPSRARNLDLAQSYYDRADAALEAFGGQGGELAKAAGYLAHGDIANAEAIESGWHAATIADYQRGFQKIDGQLQDDMGRALKRMGANKDLVPSDIAEVLTRTAKFEERGGLAKFWDYAMQVIKGYQIGTGGFHIRNFMGGVLNNWLEGVSPRAYRLWGRAERAAKEGFESGAWKSFVRSQPEAADAYKIMATPGRDIVSHGQIGSEILTGGHPSFWRRINPVDPKNAWLHANHQVGEFVERRLRGAAGLDFLMKHPGDLDGAARQIAKLHFNYQDLSQFERGVVKRVIPFYTWTRKNLPLQIEMLFRRPAVFNHYEQIRRNIERMSPADQIVPNWYGPQRMLRLPFTTTGGGHAYFNSGAPQEDILSQDLLDKDKYLGMVTPLIKTPLEVWSGKRVFKDIPLQQKEVKAPGAWAAIPGLMPLLSAAGLAKQVHGSWVMRDQDSYVVEQYLPMLALARRLAPSEPKYQDQATAAWARMLGLTGLRFNTRREQRNERLRRKFEGR